MHFIAPATERFGYRIMPGGYHLRVIKPITWLDPDDCDDSDDWISISPATLPAMGDAARFNYGSTRPIKDR
jgi:hypothetical protein